MILNKLYKALGFTALALTLCPLTAMAQELRSVSAHNNIHENLIASQRNIEDQIKLNETKEFMDIILQEEDEPEIDIYTESWNSNLVNPYAGEVVPDNVPIDVSEYAMPVPGYMTSPYGYRPRFRRMHKGVDLKLQIGDTVRAAFSGKVRLTKYERRGYGYYVIVRHHNGLETVYGHLSKFLVKPNQDVKVGDPIALGGNTGRSTGPHLHFETRYMGYAINPSAISTSRTRQLTRTLTSSTKRHIRKLVTTIRPSQDTQKVQKLRLASLLRKFPTRHTKSAQAILSVKSLQNTEFLSTQFAA